MKHRSEPRVPKTLVSIMIAGLFGVVTVANAAPTYTVKKVLVADDQWQGEDGLVDPKPIYKPHETDASFFPDYWISSNERGDEAVPGSGKGGITVLKNGSNAVLSRVDIESACIRVVKPSGALDGCAPAGAEGHPRHPHGIDIDQARKLAYQVIEHSGLKWNAKRTATIPAQTTDEESGLLVVYDIKDPSNPKILKGYVLGHAAEESAVNEANGKVYVGNHEPSPTNVPCFVSVIDPSASKPYKFIDLPSDHDCVQGVEVDEGLGTVNGTTHIGQKMFTFNSSSDTIAYSVDIRGAFDAFVAGLPASDQFTIPDGWVIHMHDLTTDKVGHRAYQTIHTIADAATVEPPEGTVTTEADEITGRWVAEVNTNPRSRDFKKVRIIDLSNGQSVPAVRTHEDAVATGLPFDKLFVHAHFLAVDPLNNALLVSGEHTGNLGVVDTGSRNLQQVVAISRPIPNCVLPPPEDPTAPPATPEPHVHGVNIQAVLGTAYVSDEGEDCFYESVTVLKP